jgi:hypothetical protein
MESNMLSIKKSVIALFALNSAISFAGTAGSVCSPANVTIPCAASAWSFEAQALYMQPVFNGNGGSYLGRFTLPDILNLPPAQTLVDNRADRGWGFKLAASYNLDQGNDLTLNWYHLNDHKNTRLFGPNFAFFGTLSESEDNADQEAYTTKPKWNAVNIEVGQHVDYGFNSNIRFHAGLQYANMQDHVNVLATAEDQLVYNFNQSSKFDGFGPRIGADMARNLGKGLAVYINGATTLLTGTSKINQYLTSVDDASFIPSRGSKVAIIPELEAKFGFKYSHPLAQGQVVSIVATFGLSTLTP